MANEPDVLVVTQLGLETTRGTAVTDSKRLRDLSIWLDPNIVTKFFRAMGRKAASAGVKHREWTAGGFNSDVPGYNSLAYVLSGLFGNGTVTQIGVTGAYTWPISPQTGAADPYKTFTVKNGIPSQWGLSAAFGALLSLNINFGQEDLTISGDAIGRAVDTAASLNASPTDIAQIPIAINDLSWYIDNTYGGVGSTLWTNVLEATLSIPRVREPKFVQNAAVQSFDDLVEVPRENSTLTIVAEYNAQTRGFVDAQKADSLPVRYIQHKFIGDNIGVSADYLFKGNYCVKLEKCAPRRNVQGVYAWEFVYRLMDDPTMGRDLEFTVVNTLSAL